MPFFSIIIPVYNVEPYLRECLESIAVSDLDCWEAILVDDGSPDGCPQICDEYAAKDRRFRVIHQKNAGVAAARNAGLDAAQGEWIWFVDSDDVVDMRPVESIIAWHQRIVIVNIMYLSIIIPVIATSLVVFTETIQHNYDGLLVVPNNSVAFSEAMRRIFNYFNLLSRLSDGAFHFGVGDKYDWNNNAKQTKAFYKS